MALPRPAKSESREAPAAQPARLKLHQHAVKVETTSCARMPNEWEIRQLGVPSDTACFETERIYRDAQGKVVERTMTIDYSNIPRSDLAFDGGQWT
ncbi:hypothetical protein [Streptomyces sp. HUAS TT7]|uniref:hypothetical protein n=1 Tax=Streptomyces sp. HUAS TT7 TaxID=3447507 RepID=UPI003F656FAB